MKYRLGRTLLVYTLFGVAGIAILVSILNKRPSPVEQARNIGGL